MTENGALESRWIRIGLIVGGVVALLVAAATLYGLIARPGATFDGPTFASVAELTSNSDLVVVGSVEQVLEKFESGSTSADAIPMLVYDLQVDEVLKGPNELRTVPLGYLDLDRIRTSDVSPIEPGQQLLLFLEQVTVGETAVIGSVSFDLIYVPVGGTDVSVFDVRDGLATPRSDVIQGLANSSDLSPMTIDAIRDLGDSSGESSS